METINGLKKQRETLTAKAMSPTITRGSTTYTHLMKQIEKLTITINRHEFEEFYR